LRKFCSKATAKNRRANLRSLYHEIGKYGIDPGATVMDT
jgi:hypothetical protein